MEKEIVIGGIIGSLRKDSYNKMLMFNAKKLLPENVQLNILSIADIPLYNGDLDMPGTSLYPESVQVFRDGIKNADGLLITSPEYNYSIPGVLKNAIDWASRGEDSPLLNKPVSLMGASMGIFGTARGQLAFYPIFQYLNMQLVKKPEVYIIQAQNKFDTNGNLTEDFSKNQIMENLQKLVHLIRRQKS